MISVLATPGTVARDYTRELVRAYAANCVVTLVGSTALAGLAEDFMQGARPSDEGVSRETAPAFVEAEGRRTDCIVLACTHYPLLITQLERLAPWPVEWIDRRRPSRGAPTGPARPDWLSHKFRRRSCTKGAGGVYGLKIARSEAARGPGTFGIDEVNIEPMPLVFA